jgi:hypothetical protein
VHILDFKLSPYCECCVLSSGLFPGVCSLNFSVLEHSVSSSLASRIHTYWPMEMEQTQCSETLAFKLQTPVNHPEESIQQYVPNWRDALLFLSQVFGILRCPIRSLLTVSLRTGPSPFPEQGLHRAQSGASCFFQVRSLLYTVTECSNSCTSTSSPFLSRTFLQ